MTNSNIDFPPGFAELEFQIKEIIDESADAGRMATTRVQLQRKDLNNYELQMRSHAERCVAGR